MTHNIQVTLNGQTVQTTSGSNIADLLEQYPHPGRHPALGAIVDHQLSGLGRRLRGNSVVTTVDLSSKAGADIYRRTAVLILSHAVEKLYPKNQIVVGQSISRGYFFFLRDGKCTPQLIKKIEQEMRRLCDADLPIRFTFMPVDEIIRYYDALGLQAKADILRQSITNEVLVAQLEDRYTMPYGPLAMHTGAICYFSLAPYEDGMVLRFPDQHGRLVKKPRPQPRLFSAFREAQRWNEVIGVSDLSQLNRELIAGRAGSLIRLVEGLHEKKIVQVADQIAARRDKVRLILIAGPSSSGKTTTSMRLDIQLRVNGIQPVTLNMDNYYRPPEETPHDEKGQHDFEHIEALDLPLLQDHLPRLIAGELVPTPIFNFNQHRRDSTRTLPLQLRSDQVLVMEGIHALNPKLTEGVPQAAKFKLFVSALTQLTIDEHNRIFTSDARLIRRIVRDRLFRNYSAQKTIEMWDNVRKGEERWIFPFQEEADVLFNSALIYEQSVLTTYAKRFLMEVSRDADAFVEADRLLRVLDFFIPILPEEVPSTSVLREFIGGSAFHY